MLIDGMEGVAGAIQIGGDGSGSLEGNLPTQAPLALFSGVVKVGADGEAEVAFDLPAFNGSVRVMAVAWSKAKVGSAPGDVIVRDPVVVAGDACRASSTSATARSCMSTSTMSKARRATISSISTSTARSTADADALSQDGQARRASARVGRPCRSPPPASARRRST